MKHSIICAGFGGQGVMSMGQLLSYSSMIEGKQVSWLPSYGPEMRGGTANCHVTVSDKPIGSPIITKSSIVVAMNLPSMVKFEDTIVVGGTIFVNSSLIEKKVDRNDINAIYVPANEIAQEIGNAKAANMVMLGALLEHTNVVKEESIIEAFKKVFGKGKEHLIDLNKEALKRGREAYKAAK